MRREPICACGAQRPSTGHRQLTHPFSAAFSSCSVWNNVGPPWPCESNPCDGPVTVFALPITTSCAFNRTLWRKTGNQIGRESRAFWNAKGDVRGGTYWTPVVNVVRDPRWGAFFFLSLSLPHLAAAALCALF